MSDDRARTPVRGVTSRPARDTLDSVRVLEGRVAVLEASDELQADALRTLGVRPQTNWLGIIGLATSIGAPILGLAFAAGHYPDRAEFEDARRRDEAKLDGARKDVAELERGQTRLTLEIEAAKLAQARAEQRLVQLEQALRRKGGK